MTLDLAAVPGVAETRLPGELIATLPVDVAPAPWQVRGSALVWWSRAGQGAREALPPALRSTARPLTVVGGFVRYEDTPVGTYDEVFGVVVSRIGRRVVGTVAFMAVDSPSSLVGGRTNWAMPKTLAAFEGAPDGPMTATGDAGQAWRVSATPRVMGPPVPVFSRARMVQEFPEQGLRSARLSARARGRLARVSVEVDAGHLPTWLEPGQHLGAVLTGMRFGLGTPGA